MRIGSLGFVAGLALTLPVCAEDFAVSNQFQAGTPAVAADVNTNFNEVAGAINAMAARLDALEGAAKPDLCAQGALSAAYKGNDSLIGLRRVPAGDSDPNNDPDPAPDPSDPDYFERYWSGFTKFDLSYIDYDVCLNSDNTFYIKHTAARRAEAIAEVGGSVMWNAVSDDENDTVTEGTYVLHSDCRLSLTVPGAWTATVRGTPRMDFIVLHHPDDSEDTFSQQTTIWTLTTDTSHACTPD